MKYRDGLQSPHPDELGPELSAGSLHSLIQAIRAGHEPISWNPHCNAEGEIDSVLLITSDIAYRGTISASKIPLAEIRMPVEYDPIVSSISERYDKLKLRVEKIKENLEAVIEENDSDLTAWLQNNPNRTDEIGPAEEALKELPSLRHDLEEARAQLAFRTNTLLLGLYKAACRSDVADDTLLHSTNEEASKIFQAIATDLDRIQATIHQQTWRAIPPAFAR